MIVSSGAPPKTTAKYLWRWMVVLIAISLCVLFWLYTPPSAEYLTLEREHFVIKYTARDQTVIHDIVAALEDKYPKVVNDIRPSTLPKIQVTVYPGLLTYHRALGMPFAPLWVVGNADPDDGSIHMVSPLRPGPTHDYQSIISVAVHEMVHSVCLHLNPSHIQARWLSEGVAAYYADQFRDPKVYLERSEYPTLNELNTTTKHYNFGYVLIDFIIDRWGTDALRELIIASGNIPEVLGLSVTEFESQWHQFLRTKYLAKTAEQPWSRAVPIAA